jgi:hypothetical protein
LEHAANTRSLEVCCIQARRARISALLGPMHEPSLFNPMLYDLVAKYTPSRLYEVNQTLFGALTTDEPFWGIYEKVDCPTCGRDLHVLLMDAQMIMVIDQLTRQLYDLLDTKCGDELRFVKATPDQRARAARILAHTVFRTGKSPMIHTLPAPGERTQAWLTEAMRLAYVFTIVHETSHQGPQSALGASSFIPQVAPALAGAALYGLTLDSNQALCWAKELWADVNACLIIVADSLRSGLRDEARPQWYQALIAGVGLALKAWDLMLDEFCYGNAYLSRSLLRTHPPARWRIEYLTRSSQVWQRLGVISGDRLWADRIMDALGDLHQLEGRNPT